MTMLNRTVFDVPITWDRAQFVLTRNKCRCARRLVEISINGKLMNKWMNKKLFFV